MTEDPLWTVFCLPNALATLTFGDEAIPGIVLDETNTVLSATTEARRLGVRPGMDVKLAFAFASSLKTHAAVPCLADAWLQMLLLQLTSLTRTADQILFEHPAFADDCLLLSIMHGPGRPKPSVAPLRPDLRPVGLLVGTGLTQALALAEALTNREQSGTVPCTTAELAQMSPHRFVTTSSPSLPATLGDLMRTEDDALPPEGVALKRWLRGDKGDDVENGPKTLKVDPDIFDLTLPLMSPTTDPLAIHRQLLTASQVLDAWRSGNADVATGTLTLQLEGKTSSSARQQSITVSATDTPQMIADQLTALLCRNALRFPVASLRFSWDEDALEVQALADVAVSPTGLAATLIQRLGSARVFALSDQEEDLPQRSAHLPPVAPPLTRHPLPEFDEEPNHALPTMLLPEPIRLPENAGHPVWSHAHLTLVSGPVRHQDAWTIRDYYVAEASHGQRVWLFQNEHGWHLHGLFA